MTSRLYPITRRLFRQVMQGLVTLRLGAVLSPLVLSLTALYITATFVCLTLSWYTPRNESAKGNLGKWLQVHGQGSGLEGKRCVTGH
jgi:hypothetical protein